MLPWLRGYAAPAVTRSFTRVFFCKTLTTLKKLSVLGFPHGASMR